MKTADKTAPDFLVDDVRRRRAALDRKFGGNLERWLEAIRRLQDAHPEKVVDLRRKKSKL